MRRSRLPHQQRKHALAANRRVTRLVERIEDKLAKIEEALIEYPAGTLILTPCPN